MTQIVKKLIQQGILYNISVLIFQSFITFYVIKYFDGIQGAIVGNIMLYVAVTCGYLLIAWINRYYTFPVKKWMFFAMVICLLSTCMMQRKTTWLLLLGYVLLGFGKGIYFCCLYLYEFKYIDASVRTKYAAIQGTWKSATEILIPLILGYLFSILPIVQSVYLIIFIAAGLMLMLTALAIYRLPVFNLEALAHSHYKAILKQTSRVAISYLTLVGLNAIIPFIGSLLEVQLIQHESWTGLFQGITKGVTLLILLIILRFSHINHPTRYFMKIAFLLGVSLLLLPRWGSWMVLIIYVISRSLLLSLFTTYEKPIGMKVMESMSKVGESMLPAIMVRVTLESFVRIIILIISYFILAGFGVVTLTYGIILLSGLGFVGIAGLTFYYLYEKAHGNTMEH